MENGEEWWKQRKMNVSMVAAAAITIITVAVEDNFNAIRRRYSFGLRICVCICQFLPELAILTWQAKKKKNAPKMPYSRERKKNI